MWLHHFRATRALLLERVAAATSQTPTMVMSVVFLQTVSMWSCFGPSWRSLISGKWHGSMLLELKRCAARRQPLLHGKPHWICKRWRRLAPPMPAWVAEVAIASVHFVDTAFVLQVGGRGGVGILETHVCGAASFVLGGGSSGGEGLLLAHPIGHLG